MHKMLFGVLFCLIQLCMLNAETSTVAYFQSLLQLHLQISTSNNYYGHPRWAVLDMSENYGPFWSEPVWRWAIMV